jgi:hypothetical protein
MGMISCPKCSTHVVKGGYNTWQIVVAVCFFPLGLLALLADKKPTTCGNCGNIFQA